MRFWRVISPCYMRQGEGIPFINNFCVFLLKISDFLYENDHSRLRRRVDIMKQSYYLFNNSLKLFVLVGFLALGGLLSILGILPRDMAEAQVGRCTTLTQSYITCNDVSGRNSTIKDIGKRFGGSSNEELIFSESLLGTPDIQPFQFSPLRDSSIVGLPDLSLSGRSRNKTMENFSNMSSSLTLPPFNPKTFDRTESGATWVRP